MPIARALAFVALVLPVVLLGCDSSAPQLVFDVQVIDADGDNPLIGLGATVARFTVQQADGTPVVYEEAVVDEGFDARLIIDPNLIPTYAAVEFLDEAGDVLMLGAAPPFDPAETAVDGGYFLFLVVGAPSSCDVLAGQSLATARTDFAVADAGTYGFLLGGEDAAGASASVEWMDLLRLTIPDPGAPLGQATGPAAATNLSPFVSLVVSRDVGPFTYDPGADTPSEPLPLHLGANHTSALSARGELGAFVGGGGDDAARSDGATWVSPDRSTVATTLAHARSGASAVASSVGVLVAGGMAADAFVVEQLEPGLGLGVGVAGSENYGEWNDPHLFIDENGEQALVIGGTDAMGTPRAETLLITGCPAACTAQLGPTWSNPRGGTTALPSQNLIIGGVATMAPSTAIDQVRFGAGSATITRVNSLDIAREIPGVLPIGGGSYMVIGGRGASGVRADVEVCFPATLTQ